MYKYKIVIKSIIEGKIYLKELLESLTKEEVKEKLKEIKKEYSLLEKINVATFQRNYIFKKKDGDYLIVKVILLI